MEILGEGGYKLFAIFLIYIDIKLGKLRKSEDNQSKSVTI